MIINWKKLVVCLAIPLAVGGLSALLTMGSMEEFGALEKPPLSPPSILFPIVWTVLFLLMGISSYLIASSRAAKREINGALTVYGIQLVFNFFWSLIFFNWGMYLFALIWLAIMIVLIIIMIVRFARISPAAAWLQVPYLLWTLFAAYLNAGIYILN